MRQFARLGDIKRRGRMNSALRNQQNVYYDVGMNSHSIARLAALGLALVVTTATASFHTFVIESIYSNADGTVQYVVLRESSGTPSKNLWAGQTFTSTRAGIT